MGGAHSLGSGFRVPAGRRRPGEGYWQEHLGSWWAMPSSGWQRVSMSNPHERGKRVEKQRPMRATSVMRCVIFGGGSVGASGAALVRIRFTAQPFDRLVAIQPMYGFTSRLVRLAEPTCGFE